MPTTRRPRSMGLACAASANSKKEGKKDSESRALQRVLNRAEYEVNVDPYRGMMSLDNGIADEACPWRICQFIENVESEHDEQGRKVFLAAHCACPSLIAWTKKHDETAGKRRTKRSRNPPETKMLGRRPDDPERSFSCDYNPFCLASVAGVMDDLIAQAATNMISQDQRKSHDRDKNGNDESQNLPDVIQIDEDGEAHSNLQGKAKCASDLTGMTEQPMIGQPRSLDLTCENNVYSKATAELLKQARIVCKVDHSSVQKYIQETIMPHTQGDLSVDSYMSRLASLHKPRIFSNPLIHESHEERGALVALALPPGIRNLGATCYLNTQLQCLARNLAFLDGIFSWKPSMDVGDGPDKQSRIMMNSVLSTLQLLLARMVHGGEATVTTEDFSSALGLETDEMQDPNEFARLLFERMHESFAKNSGLSGLLPSLFQGAMVYETTCLTCQSVSEREESFMDLNLPITKLPPGSTAAKRSGQLSITESFSAMEDTNVQICLDQYLRPEALSGDNQYFCETCKAKQDAQRSVMLHRLPPVLNVQISRYVFDRTKLTKNKLTDKVLLPRTLRVPEKEKGEFLMYRLCAVMKHQGSSAYRGHYVAEAMDWQSGTWYEFNDETVSVLDDGPSCSYDFQKYAESKLPTGSEDAYNMYYVRETFFAKTTYASVVCHGGRVEEESVIRMVADERCDRYTLLSQMCRNDGIIATRLTRRRTELIQKFASVLTDPKGALSYHVNLARGAQSPVWVDGDALREFLACRPNQPSLGGFPQKYVLRHRHHLCKHGAGLHPRVARRGKLLSRPLYDAYVALVRVEFSHSNPSLELEENDCVISPTSNLFCGECAAAYRRLLSTKLELVVRLKKLYDDLAQQNPPLSPDDTPSDSRDEEFVYCLSKTFVTKFRIAIMRRLKSLQAEELCPLGSSRTMSFESMRICEGLDALDVSPFVASMVTNDYDGTKSDIEGIDRFINTSITCEHGGLSVSSTKRNVKCVPEVVWRSLKAIYPRAITHKRKQELPPSVREGYPGRCRLCQNEQATEEQLRVRFYRWALRTQSSHLERFIRGPRSMEEVLSHLVGEKSNGLIVCEYDVFLVHRGDAFALRKVLACAKGKGNGFETLERIQDILFSDSSTDSCHTDSTTVGERSASIVVHRHDRLWDLWRPKSIKCHNHGLPCQSALFPADSILPEGQSEWVRKLVDIVEPLTRAEYLSFVQSIYSLALIIESKESDDHEALQEVDNGTLLERVRSLSNTCHHIIHFPLTTFDDNTSPLRALSSTGTVQVCRDPTCNSTFKTEQIQAMNDRIDALNKAAPDIVDVADADGARDDSVHLRVFTLQDGKSVTDVISYFLPTPQTEADVGTPGKSFLRRSSRKKKFHYPNELVAAEDVLKVKLQHNVAALRLFMLEKCHDYQIDQRLTLVVPPSTPVQLAGEEHIEVGRSANEENVLIELPFNWNEKSLNEVLLSCMKDSKGVFSMDLMRTLFLCREITQLDLEPGYARQHDETALMDSVFEAANTTTEKASAYDSNRYTKKQKVERGFRGTFLHAAKPSDPISGGSMDETEMNPGGSMLMDSDGSTEKMELVDRVKKSFQGRKVKPKDDAVLIVDESDDENKNGSIECMSPGASSSTDVVSTMNVPRKTPHVDVAILNDLIKCLTASDMPIHDGKCREAVRWAQEQNPVGTTHRSLVDNAFAKYLNEVR